MAGLDDTRLVRRVSYAPTEEGELASDWPFTLPPVAQLVREGLELGPGVTFLVGENGSGKSTLLEAIAMAYGMGPEGGSRGSQHSTRPTESALHRGLTLERTPHRPWGFFLRAETMHGFYTYLEEHPGGGDPDFHAMSHGESFLAILATRFIRPGFYCLDEPESALSFTACLSLLAVLADIVAAGGQILCATHSPLLAAMPGATILQLDEDGLRPTTWDELALVAHWRRYLADPRAYLRHVLD